METLTLALLTGIAGMAIGLIMGTLLGWRRVVEIYDENETLRLENSKLKNEPYQPTTKVIEIKDNRPEAADITKNYFTEF